MKKLSKSFKDILFILVIFFSHINLAFALNLENLIPEQINGFPKTEYSIKSSSLQSNVTNSGIEVGLLQQTGLDTISRDDFFLASKKARFTQINNVPVTNPPILYDSVACTWNYVDALGIPFPDSTNLSTNLGIRPGNAYIHLSDQTQCVVGFDCTVTLIVQGQPQGRNFRKRITPAQIGDGCLIEASGNIVEE